MQNSNFNTLKHKGHPIEPRSRRKSLFFLLFIFLLINGVSFAQSQLPKALREKNGLTEITTEIEPHGWYHFKEGTQFTDKEFFDKHASDLGLGKDDQMKEIRRI